MKITGNEPANPTKLKVNGFTKMIEVEYPGLSIRQQFASMAMQGMWQSTTDPDYDNYKRIAQMSVMQADALIAELNKEP